MATAALHRKVLFLNDEPSIRNLLSLLKRFERENTLTATGDPLLASLDQKQFDAAVIDLRSSRLKAGDEVRGIRKIRAGWVGKLLVIIAEVNGPKTLDLLERYLLNGLPDALLWLVSHPYNS
jgi:DNA-binding response OmpR family regulator